ncbi:MAG TPA: hypothetical protein VJZ49_00575 [Syntrophales bacterium]|nr:hypothetical protein [Syntrophales bacterium]
MIKLPRFNLLLRSREKTAGVIGMAVSSISQYARLGRKLIYHVVDVWKDGGNRYCLLWMWVECLA